MTKISTKSFVLKHPETTTVADIAAALGVQNGGLVFPDASLVENDEWVGQVIDENTFVLAMGRTDLHEKASRIADPS